MKQDNLLSQEVLSALLSESGAAAEAESEKNKLELILDLDLEISVQIGSVNKSIGELLDLQTGTVIELNRLINEPIDLLINGKVMARGEVVTIKEFFGVKITAIQQPVERIEHLR